MWLSVARLSADAFARVQKDPSYLDALFFDDDDDAKARLAELGIEGDVTAGFDYRIAYEALTMMAEATGEEIDEDAPVLGDLQPSGEIDYDAGYGAAFFFDPDAVARAAKESSSLEIDEETKELFEAAEEAGDHVVGVIS